MLRMAALWRRAKVRVGLGGLVCGGRWSGGGALALGLGKRRLVERQKRREASRRWFSGRSRVGPGRARSDAA
jgi:hypothetical protein